LIVCKCTRDVSVSFLCVISFIFVTYKKNKKIKKILFIFVVIKVLICTRFLMFSQTKNCINVFKLSKICNVPQNNKNTLNKIK
jgi:hypothetical protein